jgi:(p)ppGpp synthase/HD superfamily hydrolase
MTYTGLDRAIALASEKFIGIYDKSGEPYILHCLQVMTNVKKYNDIELSIAAVLHDIVEDTDITFDNLEELGYSPRVIKIIKHVTREDDISYDDEIARICNDQDSIKVKMADLEHNSSILRLKGIRQKDLERIQKYHRAYFILQAHLKN